jgi:hypothetical protein
MGMCFGTDLSDEAWARAQLPLREGRLASGAGAVSIPRTAAAYAATWSRTADVVADRRGSHSIAELLELDVTLAAKLQASADALRAAGLAPATVPWDSARIASHFLQAELMLKLASQSRWQSLASLLQPSCAVH